jgi:hypothetical protein
MRQNKGFAALALVVAFAAPAVAQLPFDELDAREASEAFLNESEITDAVKMAATDAVTEPHKLTLVLDGVTRKALWKNPQGRVKGFVEGWKYEIAAYELDKYLGTDMVPPTVGKRFKGSLGSAQLWIDVWVDFEQMTAQGLTPPGNKVDNFNKRVYLQRAFDNLIANEDRHLRNILLTEDWRMILIDHSRSFRFSKKHQKKLIFSAQHSEGPKLMKRLPKTFIEKIKGLDLATMNEVVGEYLTEDEIAAVLIRRELILKEVDRLVAEYGERSTLY